MTQREKLSFLLSALALTALAIAGSFRVSAAQNGTTHTIVIEGVKFTPSLVRAKQGDRVVFQNKDLLPHTATAQTSKAFDSGLIAAGKSWTLHLATAGTLRYVCLYHPTMEGTLVVAQP